MPKILIIGLTLLVGLAAPPAVGATSPVDVDGPVLADTILINGRIHTMDPADRIVDAIAIRDGIIVARGTAVQMERLATRGRTKVIDLRQRVVTPGLVDPNIHATRMAYYCWTNNLRVDFIQDRAEVLAGFSRVATANPPDTWLWTTRLPAVFNPKGLNPPGMFTRAELDRVAPRNPVFIMGTGFGLAAQVNSRALVLLGMSKDTPGVVLDPATGIPTGELRMPAMDRARTAISGQFERETLHDQERCFADFMHDMSRWGLTSIKGSVYGGIFNGGAWSFRPSAPGAVASVWENPRTNGGGPVAKADGLATPASAAMAPPPPFEWDGNPNRNGIRPVQLLHETGLLSTRVNMMLDQYEGGLSGVRRSTYHAIGMIGDDTLRLFGIGPGFFMQKVPGGNTATTVPPEPEYADVVNYLVCNRWSASDQTYNETVVQHKLAVWEAAARRCGGFTGLHWTFEGVQAPLSQNSLDRIKALGVGVTTFSSVIQGESPLPDIKGPTPFRQLQDSGVMWCMGSDGVLGNPSQPFGHIWYAVSGNTLVAGRPGVPPDQRLTRLEALRARTSGCSWHVNDKRIGTISVGSHADLIALSADYFSIPVGEIKNIESVLTLVDGRIVYAAAEFRGQDAPFRKEVAAYLDGH